MDFEPELGDDLDALDTLSMTGYLDSNKPSFGIAKLYLHEGYQSLSSKQKFLFDKEIAPVIYQVCGACGESIEMSALMNAFKEGRMLCSYHMYQYRKND